MGVGLVGIDHPVIAVRDMAEARQRYQRLGFTLPPRGRHLEWGTGNWCIMFADDYLELRGVVDPGRYLHGLDRFLARREGLMGVAFRPEAAEATYRQAKAAGIEAAPPRELTRAFELPEGDVHPRFRLVFFPESATVGLMASLACEHLTPELIRRPDWLSHANGALGVAEMQSVALDLDLVEEQQRRLFGSAAIHRTSDHVRVDAGGGAALDVMTPVAAARLELALPGVEPPYLAGTSIRVSDLTRTEEVLRRNGVPHRPVTGGLRIGADDAGGLVLKFVEV